LKLLARLKKKAILESLKYYKYLKYIKKYGIVSIKELERRLYDINLYYISYKQLSVKYYKVFNSVFSNLIYLYKKYSKYHKDIYPHKHSVVSKSKGTDYINKIKYKFFTKNLLNLVRENINPTT
jgi:hypothetical protein